MKKHENKTVKLLLTLFFIVACILSASAQIDTTGINNAAQAGLEVVGEIISIKFPYISHVIVGLVVTVIMGVIRYFEKKALTKKKTTENK